MKHWRRHDDVVAKLVDTYAEDGSISGHGAYAVNATACGHLVPHGETEGDPAKASCPECVALASVIRGESFRRLVGLAEEALRVGVAVLKP